MAFPRIRNLRYFPVWVIVYYHPDVSPGCAEELSLTPVVPVAKVKGKLAGLISDIAGKLHGTISTPFGYDA